MQNKNEHAPLDQYGDEYPAVLENEQEIADYCASTVADISAGVQFEEVNFRNRYRGCRAILQLIPSDRLTEGWEGDNQRFPARELRYGKLDPRTQPPLLVQDGVVHDGNHRLRIGRKQGKTCFWSYDVEYSSDRDSGIEYQPYNAAAEGW